MDKWGDEFTDVVYVDPVSKRIHLRLGDGVAVFCQATEKLVHVKIGAVGADVVE